MHKKQSISELRTKRQKQILKNRRKFKKGVWFLDKNKRPIRKIKIFSFNFELN